MQVEKEDARALYQAIDQWLASGTISAEQATAMRASIQPRSSPRQQLAQYFFIIAVSSALLAFGALFIHEKIIEQLRRSFLLSNYTIAFYATTLAGIGFWYAHKKRKLISATTYEVYLLPGALCTAVSLVYLCKEWGSGEGYTLFTGLCALAYFALSYSLRSQILWVFFIGALMGWFGAFSTVYSKENLFLGMNYPLRFAQFGFSIIVLSYVQQRWQRLQPMRMLSYHAGLLICFTGLWGLSVFGNFNTLSGWQEVRQAKMLPYAVVTGLMIAGALLLGIRRNDELLRDYSILFLLLHFYTRYFEYFYNAFNKALFFIVLAISFGLLARWLNKNRGNTKAGEQQTVGS